MSSALVRQALELVDPEENIKNKRRARRRPYQDPSGQGFISQKRKNKKIVKQTSKSQEEVTQENIKKLLALSKPTADSTVATKIIERAIKGKPLADKIEIKTDEDKSILFPEESFKDFENQYFCS
ncbi:uncharacterized protein [Epargyreus clarus]|uniref:uncharacterized protein isoform X2 n=1 Tax=Epargyreus clarus TaxID=520877 RepID=UPI003C2E1EB5